MLSGCLLLLSLTVQDAPQASQPSRPAAAAEAELPPAFVVNEKEARDALKKLWSAKDKIPLAQKLDRLRELAQMQHKVLVKPLADLLKTETALTVRKAAATALGRQPAADAHPQVITLLKDEKLCSAPEVAAALVQALSACGYTSADWPLVAQYFEKDFESVRAPLQRETLKLAGKFKEKQAVRLLLRHLEEPHPEDPNAADNPPAEYWEKRYKCWKAWKDEAKEALFAITGQSFSTAKEARAWLKVNGKKLGIVDF